MNKRDKGNVNINRTPNVASGMPLPYPLHKMIGVLRTEEDAWRVIDELRSQGFPEEQMELWGGQAGAEALLEHHRGGGLIDRLTHALMHFGNEGEFLDYYNEAVRSGKFVLIVPAKTAEAQELAREAIARHGGRGIVYFDDFVITKH